jgi:hypothetical protein
MTIFLAIVQLFTLLALVWYAWETRILRMHEEDFHRRERQIDYHFSIERFDPPTETDLIRYSSEWLKPKQVDAAAVVANLGRLALLLGGITIRVPKSGAQEREYRILHLPLAQGGLQHFIVADFLVRYLRETNEILPDLSAQSQTWTEEVEVALLFYARKRSRQSEWQRYSLTVRSGGVQSIHRIDDNGQLSPRYSPSALTKL